ncbi:MAG: 2-C-methyl-D-erythritol 4-phosphate cytidylyltransferase [Actinomycetota bacterium]
MTTAALVTAAGSGTRFGGLKQFEALRPGVRLVDAVIETCRPHVDWVGLLLPADVTWDGPPVDRVAAGGDSRHATLAIGVELLPADHDHVVIHSASHPLASAALVTTTLDAVRAGADAAVPLWQPPDVIKDGRSGTLRTVGREGFGLAQSPMAFRRRALIDGLAAANNATEESALVERAGGTVVAVDGEATNVHVIDRLTLAMARAIAVMGPA